jgi:type I restriction-modification system DNA methylase subunit
MAKQRQTSNLTEQQKQFVKVLDQISYGQSSYETFRDFCELSAISFVGVFIGGQEAKERLERIHSKYGKDKIVLFGKAMDILIDALETEYRDFLGEVYMALDISNARSGQFFTPYCLCKMMSKMQLPEDLEKMIEDCGGYITVNDCACGAGAMLIATVDEFKARKVDYSNKLFIVAQDIDLMCCYMAYIQLSLSGVAAMVVCGNTLTNEQREVWYTPTYYLNYWTCKIALRNLKEIRTPENVKPAEVVEALPKPDIKVIKDSSGQFTFDFAAEIGAVA